MYTILESLIEIALEFDILRRILSIFRVTNSLFIGYLVFILKNWVVRNWIA